MHTSQLPSALAAARSSASESGLRADDAVVLQNSNRLAVHLLPCDVFARVAPASLEASALFEVEVARRLAEARCPVADLDPRVEPRVDLRDGFAITFWTYYEPVTPAEIARADYARALETLHAGMRQVDYPVPHFTDRVAEAEQLVDSPARTPGLAEDDRKFLGDALRTLSRLATEHGAPEQLLHGEPHPGNLLNTKKGLLFIDLETVCRGPVEFDLAHVPEEVGACYRQADPRLVAICRALMLGMVSAWRWDRDDEYPDGLRMGAEFLSRLRESAVRLGLDLVS